MTDPGSSNAFLHQLEPIRHTLYAFARRAASQPEEADDLVAQATMIGWREFDRFMPGTNFKAWMFRILVNTIYSDNKRARRDAVRQAESASIDDLATDLTTSLEQEDAWESLRGDPRQLAELLDERLVAALASIDDDPKRALLLRMIGDLSYREISEMLQVPVGTVMSHVHRARRELRQRLAHFAVERRLSPEFDSGADDAML